ncbi:MAG: nuclear transport factor 2 family protein [Chitinophagaceae bacterium]|nr:nuclear transport factor 2 family protein [Chitinophagaceae bacterium]
MNTETLTTKDQQDLWNIMQQINNCWYKGQPAQLADYFHDNIVFNSPDLKQQFTGKEICIKSYIDFLSNSKVLLYNETNPIVHVFDNTAIITYDFEMKYEQKDKVYHETGTDIMIFNKQQNSWKVVWRSLANLKNL